MKLDWRKDEKAYYLPKDKPEYIKIPAFKFFTIKGTGNPNDPSFGEYISALYSLTYAIKMSPKQQCAPQDYNEYTVYPLEGVWSLTEEGIKNYDGKLDKDQLSFTMMIRQPDFVTESYAHETIERIKRKKPNKRIGDVKFESLEDGPCVQMLHLGSYDTESASFEKMEDYAKENKLRRVGHIHKEIYLSDPGRTDKDRLKTVLRFKVENL